MQTYCFFKDETANLRWTVRAGDPLAPYLFPQSSAFLRLVDSNGNTVIEQVEGSGVEVDRTTGKVTTETPLELERGTYICQLRERTSPTNNRVLAAVQINVK